MRLEQSPYAKRWQDWCSLYLGDLCLEDGEAARNGQAILDRSRQVNRH